MASTVELERGGPSTAASISPPVPSPPSMPQPVSSSSILSVATFLINVIAYIVLNGMDCLDQYESLVRPADEALAVWALIFVWEGAFLVARCLWKSESTSHVSLISVCAFQTAWLFALAFHLLSLSFLFMFGIWVSLLCLLLVRMYHLMSKEEPRSVMDENTWISEIPFNVHFAWITVLMFINFNAAVGIHFSAATELAVAIWSIGGLLIASCVFALYQKLSMVITMAWSTWWIYSELQAPSQYIHERFRTSLVTDGVAYAVMGLFWVNIFSTVVILFIKTGRGKSCDPRELSKNNELSMSTCESRTDAYDSHLISG